MVMVATILFFFTAISAVLLREKEEIAATITRLGYVYAPAALVSLVLGLGLILFQSMIDLGLSKKTVQVIQEILFAGGGAWSMYLAFRLQERWSLAIIPNLFGIGFIAFAWHKVLF